MNKFILSLLCFWSLGAFAQSYIGYSSDNYSGIHGVIVNPASMADSRLRADINLVSVSAFATNEYAEIDYRKWIKSSYSNDVDFDEDTDVEYVGFDRKNSGLVHADVLGPSVMLSINEEHSAAIYTRARVFGNVNEIDGSYQSVFEQGLSNRTEPFLVADENSFGTAAAWVELGLSYAKVLKNDKQNFIKAGITLKYIRPTHFASFEFRDGVLFFDPNNSRNNDIFGELDLRASNTLDPDNDGVRNGGASSEIKLPSNSGFGVDLGFVYEYRPQFRKNISKENVINQIKFRHINTYKLRFGVSILDIGAMTYKGATFEPYILDNLPDELNNPLILPSFNEDIKVTLPTNLRFDLDWAISDKFYLNTSSRISLISKKKTQAIRYANQFTVNPRLETRWLSVYSPLSVTQFGGMQWGLGTRLGPLFLGSGNLLGSIVDKKTRAFDVYLGLKIPLFHPIPKVKEEKETVTKLDCPFGCPEIKSGKVKRLEGYGNDSKRIKKRKVKRLQGYQGKVK